jgi:hypothetical protein
MEKIWEVVTLPGKVHGQSVVYPLVAIRLSGVHWSWQAMVEPLALVVDNCGVISTFLIGSIRNIDAQSAG